MEYLDVKVEEYAVIRPKVEIGQFTIVKCSAILGTGVKVGKHCYIGPGAKLFHGMPNGESHPCVLEDKVFIGGGAIVLPKVKICSGAIVGAGSVVTRSITLPGTYVGNPAVMVSEEVYRP